MKILLYIPPFQVEGTKVENISQIRIGGLTLFDRACRSAKNAKFDEIIVAGPTNVQFPEDPLVTIPVKRFDYTTQVKEIKTQLAEVMGDDDACICRVDGMIGPVAIGMRPAGADVRVRANGEDTGIYFLTGMTVQKAILADSSLDELSSGSYEMLDAPEKTIYHRILSSEDLKIGQDILTRSLRKKLGRDADGLVAYYFNRPQSLAISRRIANSPITPNMITGFGLIIGLIAAGLLVLGGYQNSWLIMSLAAVLWQFSSMIDGVDGELARMRMSPSFKGEWFDTIADDITNVSFMFGLGTAMSFLYPLPDNGTLFNADGGFCFPYFYVTAGVCVFMVLTLLWFYREFVKMGIASHNHFEWGFEKANKDNKVEEKRGAFHKFVDLVATGFAWICKRDFYTFLIMVLIIAGAYHVAYFVMLPCAFIIAFGGMVALSIRAIRGTGKKKKDAK